MFNKAMAALAATVLVATTAGCYQTSQQAKSADQIAQEQADLKARKAAENKSMYADAHASVAEVQQLVATQKWEEARDELHTVQRHLEHVLASREVSNEVKGHVAGLFPAIANLRTQIGDESEKAAASAEALAKQFERTTQTLLAMGWLEGTTGGGAGTTPDKDIDTEPGTDDEHQDHK